jgi:DNA-binding NarL/FixJ family response regulator
MKAQDEAKSSKSRSPIRIFIIEDHAIVRAGLRMLLENNPRMEVVCEAPNVSQLLAGPVSVAPDVIILDLDLGQENGLNFISELRSRFSPVRILVLTASTDTEVHLQAVQSGASGVVVKEQAPEMLIKAVESIHAGESWLGSALVSAVLGEFSKRSESRRQDPANEKIARLTPREREVVELITEGLQSERIAARLRISEGTVRNHLTSILAKLELSNRFELAVFAFRHGLHRPPL